MAEQFLLRLNGGPDAGRTRVATSDLLPWPLPERLSHPDESGYYEKVRESQLPPMPEGGHIMRGAEYEWRDEPAS
jgi:hypothetical protein